MNKMESFQRLANREAKRLNIEAALTMRWDSDCKYRLNRYTLAHAHCHKGDSEYGTICIKRGLIDPRETIKHEVAHFVRGGTHRGVGFLKARVKQGSKSAKISLKRMGKMRCTHVWGKRREVSRKVTRSGLAVLYEARCYDCGKSIP